MQAQRKWICLLTGLLIGIVLICAAVSGETVGDIPLYAEVLLDGKTEILQLFEDENEQFFLFLPSGAQLEHTRLRLNTSIPVELEGQVLSDGTSCEKLQNNVAYELTYTAWGKKQCSSLTFMKSANIASIYIDTKSGTMDYIHEEKGNKESGAIRIYDAEGNKSYAGELAFIKGRGNFTWSEYEKKPYSLKLEESASLLGMGAAQKWILLANASDSSYIRNKIVYSFAQDFGMAYTADSRWVDLYLNGEYAGLYQLSERNEVHSERVDIGQEDSFLVSLEMESRLEAQNYPYVLTRENQALRVHYPENPTKTELTRIESCLQSVENAILSEDGIDPETGKHWTELIDLDSWVKKYLIEEVFGNGDAGALSQYFYLDGTEETGRLYAGPVWDYDRTMGNTVSWALQEPQSFYANRLQVTQGWDTPWLYSLYRWEPFYQRMQELYQTQFLPLLKDVLTEQIWSYAEEISQSAAMDKLRWQTGNTSVPEECESIVSYMSQRIDFLSRVWLAEEAYYEVQADQSFGNHYAHYVVFPGETLPELPEFEDSEYSVFQGWYYTDTDEPVDPERPVTEDMEIYARWTDSTSKRIGRVLKLIPLGLIGAMGAVILGLDCRRRRKSR